MPEVKDMTESEKEKTRLIAFLEKADLSVRDLSELVREVDHRRMPRWARKTVTMDDYMRECDDANATPWPFVRYDVRLPDPAWDEDPDALNIETIVCFELSAAMGPDLTVRMSPLVSKEKAIESLHAVIKHIKKLGIYCPQDPNVSNDCPF